MPPTKTATLYAEVKFDPDITDAESLAVALDRLIETALSTPDVLADYGNPVIGEFYTTRAIPTRHVTTVTVEDPDTKSPVRVEIRKTEGGYLVGVDGSYLEQDVGPVYDPCSFGVELEIGDNE